MREFAREDACTARHKIFVELVVRKVFLKSCSTSMKAPNASSHQAKAASCLQVPPVQKYGGRSITVNGAQANDLNSEVTVLHPSTSCAWGSSGEMSSADCFSCQGSQLLLRSSDGVRSAHGAKHPCNVGVECRRRPRAAFRCFHANIGEPMTCTCPTPCLAQCQCVDISKRLP